MKIFSIANLACADVASKDSYERNLYGVQFEQDGATVGCNGKILLAVSPTNEERSQFPEEVCEPLEPPARGFMIPVDLVRKIQKNMSKVKKLHLMHLCMTRLRDIHRVGFTTVDEKGDPTTTGGFPRQDPFIQWRNVVHGVHKGCTLKVAVNRTDLVTLLRAMDTACPGKGDIAPLYVEVGEGGMVIRGQNFDTEQTAVGVITSLDTRGKWLPWSKWETGLFEKLRKKVPVKRKKAIRRR